MKLEIIPNNDKRDEVQKVPIGYDVKLNGISLTDIGNDLKITELDLQMKAGQKPHLVIHSDIDSMVVKDLLTDSDVAVNGTVKGTIPNNKTPNTDTDSGREMCTKRIKELTRVLDKTKSLEARSLILRQIIFYQEQLDVQ